MINITEKNLNNKSRKGLHYYVKTKGKPGRYYKHREGIPKEQFVSHYKQNLGTSKLRWSKKVEEVYKHNIYKRLPIQKRMDKYYARFPQQKHIMKNIRRGITTSNLANAFQADETAIRQSIRQHLKPLVKDENLLRVLCLEENQQKLAKQYEHKVVLIGKNGKNLVQYNTMNKTLRQVINELLKEHTFGMTWEEISNARSVMTANRYSWSPLIKTDKDKDELSKIQITTIFRRR